MSFSNPLPGVPFVESPFFDRLVATEGWTDEERRVATSLYHRGYAIIDFPEPELDALAARIIEALDACYDWARWRGGGYERGEGLKVPEAWRDNDDVKRIACNARVLELLSRVYGRRAFPGHTLNFPVGTQQDLHTDAVHFSSIPDRFMCGVWVAFEDTDEQNGSLFYHPGTNRWPIFTYEHLGIDTIGKRDPYDQYGRFVALWKSLIEHAGIAPEPFHARKGQAVIWAANLLHGGERQRDPSRTRHSQVTHYYFDGCCYYTPLLSDPFFGRIRFDALVDVSTGQPIPQTYIGRELPDDWVALAAQGAWRGLTALDFDGEAYLNANPDVRAAGIDPWEHWMRWGRRDGRLLR